MTAIAARTKRPLPEVLAEMGDVAIDAMRAETDNCRDCPESDTGICGDHAADTVRAAEFEDALEQIRAGEIVAALTAQGGNQ